MNNITGSIIVGKEGLIIKLSRNCVPIENDFDNLIAARDIILDAVKNFEKNNQASYLTESRNAKQYEEIEKVLEDLRNEPAFKELEQLNWKRSLVLDKERYYMAVDPAVPGEVNIFYLDDEGKLKQIKK